MEWIIVRTLLSLAAIIALMLGLAFVVKKYMHAGKGGRRSLVDVELLGHRSLQPRTAVYVLRVLNRVIVVGTTEHGMQTLSEMSDPETLAAVEQSVNAPAAPARWFPAAKGSAPGSTRSFADALTMSLRGVFFATKHSK
jgi:flagellar biogenesis protein FliO